MSEDYYTVGTLPVLELAKANSVFMINPPESGYVTVTPCLVPASAPITHERGPVFRAERFEAEADASQEECTARFFSRPGAPTICKLYILTCGNDLTLFMGQLQRDQCCCAPGDPVFIGAADVPRVLPSLELVFDASAYFDVSAEMARTFLHENPGICFSDGASVCVCTAPRIVAVSHLPAGYGCGIYSEEKTVLSVNIR